MSSFERVFGELSSELDAWKEIESFRSLGFSDDKIIEKFQDLALGNVKLIDLGHTKGWLPLVKAAHKMLEQNLLIVSCLALSHISQNN